MNAIESLIGQIADKGLANRDMSPIAAYCLATGIGDNEMLEEVWEIDVYLLLIKDSKIHRDTISMLRQLKAMIRRYNSEFHSEVKS